MTRPRLKAILLLFILLVFLWHILKIRVLLSRKKRKPSSIFIAPEISLGNAFCEFIDPNERVLAVVTRGEEADDGESSAALKLSPQKTLE